MSESPTAKELATILESVSEVTIFDAGRSREITRGQLKAISERDKEYGRMDAALVRARVPSQEMKHILPVFRSLLGKFVDNETDRIGNGLVNLVEGIPTPKLFEYVQILIRAAAVLGGERTAELLIGWIQGESVRYRSVSVLKGLTIEQPLTLQEGLHVYQLPKSSNELATHLPAMSLGMHGLDSMLGGVVLSIECEAEPALYPPPKNEATFNISEHTWAGGQIDNLSVDSFCEAMSLACGGCVRWKFSWRNFGEVQEFLSVYGGASWTDVPHFGDATSFNQEHFEQAREIHKLRSARGKNNPSLDTAIRRWIKSKSSNSSFADQLIDLRIALEALYLEETEGELRYRLASHGAWHVSQNQEERKQNFQTLMQSYRLASNAVHGGNIKQNDNNKKLFENAQRLCREGILKRLEEKTKPEWNDLIMGIKHSEYWMR